MEEESYIQIKDLTKRFNDVLAVDGLSLEIRKNEILGFLGPNGAGKTTTIQMICGLLEPDKGSLLLGGRDHAAALKQKGLIGICPQELVIWDYLTCEEQLFLVTDMYDIPRSEGRVRINRLLELLSLEDKKKKTAKTLSGGMKRRLNLALAVVHDPAIIILDEPEAGLDPQSRVLVRNFIKSLTAEKTVIFTTHNMDEADRVCDRVAIIDHGKLLTVDTPGNLKNRFARSNLIEAIVEKETPLETFQAALAQGLGEALQSVELVENRLIVSTSDAIQSLGEIITVLSRHGVPRENIVFRWTTLEDVFIKLTGRSLRE